MVDEDELLWFGRPPDTTQLVSADDQVAPAVRRRQAAAYAMLEDLVQEMEADLVELQAWLNETGGFSLAVPPDSGLILMLLLHLKMLAAKHLYTEVVGIIKTYDQHVEAVLANVRVLISTTDAANKLFSNLHVGPAKALHNTCKITVAILDEAQRCEMLPAAAIIANVDTVLVMADPNQRIEQDKTYAARNPWSNSGRWGSLRNPETIWVTDALGSSTNVHCARLTLCKRCGPQLTAFCNRVFSFLGDFQSHTCAPNTRLKFNFYSGENWWPASSMPHGVWRSSSDEVAWHERLFRCLGATILVQLVDLERSADGQWDCNAMVVLVACYLHRVIGPLSAYLKELVGAARWEGRLRHTVEANVQVCIVDTLTGPTAEVTHIIRHRRVTQEQTNTGVSNRIPADCTLASLVARSPPLCGWRRSHSGCPGDERKGCAVRRTPPTRRPKHFYIGCSMPSKSLSSRQRMRTRLPSPLRSNVLLC